MTELALPSSAFSSVQQYLKQKKATGQRVSPTEEKSAWSAYWDSMYGMRAEGAQLELQKESLGLQREQIESQEKAAMISGVAQLAGTTAIGAYALKGTKLGAKIGLGATSATKPLATVSGVAKGATIGAAPATPLVYGSPEYVAAGGSMAPITGAETAAAAAGEISALTAYGMPAALALGGGMLSKAIPIGSGSTTEMAKGVAVGAGIGGYMMAGTALGGPLGAVIGGVLGAIGAGSLFEDIGCIIITAATSPDSYEVNVTREYRDRFLSQQTLRGYYMVAEKIVPLMHKSKWFKKSIKKYLVDHIVKHCEWGIGLREKKPVKSSFITTTFLSLCDLIGSTVPSFARSNGEVF